MNMRSTLCAIVVAGGLMGCNPQPQYYRVALDDAPLNNLPASCYGSGNAPSPRGDTLVPVQQWIVWEGVEDRKYLQVPRINYALGDAAPVDIPAAAGNTIPSTGDGDKLTFTAERTQSTPNTRTFRAVYTFDKTPGDTIEGSLALSSTCAGTGCEPNCEASLRFTGRRIAADQELLVSGQ
jgi:hypothetical protein